MGVLSEGLLGLENALRGLIAPKGFDGGKVGGRFAAFRRSEGDVDTGFLQDVVGMGELGEGTSQ